MSSILKNNKLRQSTEIKKNIYSRQKRKITTKSAKARGQGRLHLPNKTNNFLILDGKRDILVTSSPRIHSSAQAL